MRNKRVAHIIELSHIELSHIELSYIVGLSIVLSIILSIMIVPSMASEPENVDSDIGDEYGNNVGGSSDESTGGRGVVTCEPFVNIAKVEKQKSILRNNSSTSYTISDPDFGIYFINILGSEDESDVILRTEFLHSTSKCRKVIPDVPGKIYKNVNIWLGSPMIKGSIINFQVENSWLKNNSVEKQNITIFQWNKIGAKWNKLQSNVIGEDDIYTYFEAVTNGLSQFAITGITPETKLNARDDYPEDRYPTTEGQVPFKGTGDNTIIVIGVIAIAIIVISLILIRKKK